MSLSITKGVNHSSAFVHEVFVTESVAELVAQKCIRVVPERLHVCSPLLVVVPPF